MTEKLLAALGGAVVIWVSSKPLMLESRNTDAVHPREHQHRC